MTFSRQRSHLTAFGLIAALPVIALPAAAQPVEKPAPTPVAQPAGTPVPAPPVAAAPAPAPAPPALAPVAAPPAVEPIPSAPAVSTAVPATEPTPPTKLTVGSGGGSWQPGALLQFWVDWSRQ